MDTYSCYTSYSLYSLLYPLYTPISSYSSYSYGILIPQVLCELPNYLPHQHLTT